MTSITPSRLAMYEGLIALAWVDHVLTPDEKTKLHELINANPRFSDAERTKLHEDVDKKIALADVWPRITEKEDRAHLLDVAASIFNHDGEYCEMEKSVFETFLQEHLGTLDTTTVQQELAAMAAAQHNQRIVEEQQIKDYAKEHSFFARLGRLFR